MSDLTGYRFNSYGSAESIPWAHELPPADMEISDGHLKMFFKTMAERQKIWYKTRFLKKKYESPDTILRDNKFTNVYRELDRASQWLISNVLLDHELSLKDAIWRMMIYRFYNEPNSFEHPTHAIELPHYDDFDPEKLWKQTCKYRKEIDNPWHTAYLMNLAFLKKPQDWDEKKQGKFKDYAYIMHAFPLVHETIPDIVKCLLKEKKDPKKLIKLLETLPAVSNFQSHEFFVDLCYFARYWRKPVMAFDQNDYTNVGPGASLGLRLILPSLEPNEQINGIYNLREIAGDYMNIEGMRFKYLNWDKKKGKYFVEKSQNDENFTLHQIEMYLCEYQKYWKMQYGFGKQRSKYKATDKKRSNKSFYLY